MTPILSYFLQGSFVTFMFVMFYKLLLRKDTFFKWSRWYFLCSVIASFLLPLVDVSFLLHGPTKQATFVNYIPDLSFSAITAETNLTHVIFYNLLFAGIIVMSMRLVLQLKALVKLRKNKKINTQTNFKIVELEERINPFSFFNEIYINPLLHTDAEMNEIIKHEQFHIEQKHTLDILLGEALTIAFWFNPFAWLLKNELKQNLEYLTDKLVLQSGIDAKHYQYNLLKVSALRNNNIAAANHFYFLKLKNRIIMMNKQQSKPYRLAKYLILVPVVAVMLMAFSQRKQLIEAMNTIAVADTIPVPTPPSVEMTETIAPTDPVAPKDQPLPANVKEIDVKKSSGKYTITLKLNNGNTEVYNMNNAEQKKAFEKKYGEWVEPTAPLAPLSPFTPPSAPITPLSPIAPISEPYLPADVKSMNVIKKDGANKISLELKNGKKEEFDLNNADDKKRFEEKYGQLNPPPPPPPIEKKKTALNEKGFYLSVADDAGECVIIVKDKNKKILEAVRLNDWDAAKSIYESKYGKVTELKETTVPINTNASKDGPGNPYTSVKINSTINYSNSVNLNNELVIVDGVEQPKGFLLNNIDVNTIESISVLKDKSAIAIYGEKGKNGVIIIQTKKAVKTGSTFITGAVTNSNTTSTSIKSGDYKDALVIVDGKEMTAAEMDLKIKPEQIKSVHVLKGDAAIKKYGDKGKNGVIEIEMK